MSDVPPAPTPTTHVVGQEYPFDAVRTALKGDPKPPYFVIHRDGVICGVCLGLKWNPLAEANPIEVWVGLKGDLKKWGQKLAETTGPLPVYVRRQEAGNWFYTGLYQVSGSTAEIPELRLRLRPPVITAISMVVFLKPYDPDAPASDPAPSPASDPGAPVPEVEAAPPAAPPSAV